MNTTRKIAKNTLVLTAAEIFSKVMSLILVAYIARFLGDVGFGKYSFALSFTVLFVLFADLGLSTLTIREVARDKSKVNRYLGNIALIKIILSILTFIVIFITINLMQYPSDTKIAVYVFGCYWILNSFTQLFRSIFRAFEKMEYEALTTSLEKIVAVSLGLFVLFSGYGLIELSLVILLAGIINFFVTFLVVIVKFSRPKFEIDFKFWTHLIKESLPLGLVLIFMTLYLKIDITMLSIMKGDAEVGWYNASVVIIEALAFIPGIFMISIFPVVSRFFVSSKESLALVYEKSFMYLFIIGLPIAVSTTLLADRFIFFIYGKNFINSVLVLKILIWALLLIFINHLLGTVLRSIDRQKLNALITGGAVLINIFLNLLLIPKYSYLGAAFSTVMTELFIFSSYFYYTSKFVSKISIPRIIIKPGIASLSMGIFIYSFSGFSLILLGLFCVPLYIILLYLLKEFKEDDRGLFKDLIIQKKVNK
jgi:O-antigen/teichoic acid export membrane protein